MTSTFQLDTSGYVERANINKRPGPAISWSDLSPFAQGYIEALFASSWGDIGGTHFLTTREVKDFGYADLAPETLARIIADCEAMEANKGKPGSREEGAYCWAGRQEGRKPGDYAPHPFPPLTVTLGDDGKVRFQ